MRSTSLLRRLATLVALALMLSVATDAHASKRQAKKHFKKAETHFRLGRFAEALDEYSKAYEAKALPAFLFNIAQCHMELKNYERAAFFYEQYLREQPESSNRAMVEQRLTDAKAALDKEKADKAAAAEEERKRAEEAQRLEEERIRLEQEKQRAESERMAAEKAAAEKAERERLAATSGPGVTQTVEEPLYSKWWLWAIVGGVVVGGVATAVLVTQSGGTETVLPSGDSGTIDAR